MIGSEVLCGYESASWLHLRLQLESGREREWFVEIRPQDSIGDQLVSAGLVSESGCDIANGRAGFQFLQVLNSRVLYQARSGLWSPKRGKPLQIAKARLPADLFLRENAISLSQ